MVSSQVMARRERVAALLDVSVGRGLEVGPLDSPLATKDVADVRYVDVLDRDGLRDRYASVPIVDGDDIPVVDFPLITSEGPRSLAAAVSAGGPYAWVIASHVVEHVPDVIGWLSDIADVLLDDGPLVLVVPDMRYTFDVHRHQTTLGQMLEAHDLEASRPSVRAVYDNFSTVAKNPSHDAWQGLIPGEESRYHDLNHVLEQVARVRDGEYVDCHVWTFTPLSFVEQTLALCELGVCEFVPESWEPTPPNDIEFVVVLRRLRRGMSHDERLEERRKAERLVPVADRFRGTARPEIFELSEVREELLALDANSKQIIADLRRDIGVLLHELNAIKSSERWRVGGLIASPATRVARAVRPLRRRFQRSSEP